MCCSTNTAATLLAASGLGKRYRRRWALSGCTLEIPAGRVVGLVGPNGAGKTTLLHLAAGLIAPTTGTVEVLGGRPGDGPVQLGRVGFVAQDTPVYPGLSVGGHLRMAGYLNPGWDGAEARRRIEQLGIDLRQRAGRLSGGQRLLTTPLWPTTGPIGDGAASPRWTATRSACSPNRTGTAHCAETTCSPLISHRSPRSSGNDGGSRSPARR